MKHIKNILRILFWGIVEIPVYLLGLIMVPLAIHYPFCKAYPFTIKGNIYGFRAQIGHFIQAVQPEQMGATVCYGHSVLIHPFKELKHNG